LNAVKFLILTILTFIGLYYLAPYLSEYLPFDIIWTEVFLAPLFAVIIMTMIKIIFFKKSKVTIMAFGFGAPLIILIRIEYYFVKVLNDSMYTLDIFFMIVITLAAFFYSFFAMAILLKNKK
jgi:hypothetical protein